MTMRISVIAGALMFVGGCATYPYETAFEACDDEAGACYRFCEEEPDEQGAAQCRSDCEERANLCFADASECPEIRASYVISTISHDEEHRNYFRQICLENSVLSFARSLSLAHTAGQR